MKIQDLEFELQRSFFSESLSDSLAQRFAGYRPKVRLTDENGRGKKYNAAVENWSPKSGAILITFEVESETEVATHGKVSLEDVKTMMGLIKTTAPQPPQVPSAVLPDGLDELVRQLDRAESRPGYSFVALKWFRDSVLPAVRADWQDAEKRDHILRTAIEKRWILTSKMPNPKSPEFPVTAVKLNRARPEVEAILGPRDTTSAEFHPVPIRGEALSATILRERR